MSEIDLAPALALSPELDELTRTTSDFRMWRMKVPRLLSGSSMFASVSRRSECRSWSAS